MNPPSARRAGLVVRTESRRRLRGLRDAGWRLALLALSGVLLLLPVGGMAVAAYFLGSGTFGSPATTLRAAGAAVVLLAGFVTVFVALRTVQAGDPDAPEAVLLAAPVRDVVLGLAAVETLVVTGPVVAVAVVVSAAFAVGAGSLPAVLFASLALAGGALAGASTGFALGLLVRLAIARSKLLARYKTVIGVALFLGYFAVVTGGVDLPWLADLVVLADRPPVAWFGSLATLGTLAAANAVGAAAGAVVLPAVAVAGYVASVGVAERLWFEPRVTPTESRTEPSGMAGGFADRLGVGSTGAAGPIPPASVTVARRSWLRARRAPISLLYVVYPLFVVGGPLSTAIRTGVVPGWLPAALPLYGAWATAAAFTLNPIGDEGAVLPVTLTSGVSGRAFVLGRCLAGAAVGVPLTAAVTAAAAVAASFAPVATLAVVVNALVLPVAAAGIGAAVGTALPQFEASRITRSRRAVVPSLLGFAAFSLALVLLSVPALVGGTPVVGEVLESLLGVDAAVVAVVGVGATMALALVGGGLGFRYAATRFDGYYPDGG
ncbi:hypothetical protein ACFO0N_02730 [Halobium salinum]|uniref:ABC-2 type transport system permease protein n=1 Tax=Halobium salinum TaxID=1364940 RepID=A0ABD5P7J6_9EURY|nr:hypothetical protein [Halobium salinum]